MGEIVFTLKFAVFILALVLGLSCIVMGFLSTKSGAEAMKERIEYGFLGVSGLAVTGLMLYAL
ncbi:hypothetical protein [Glaciecola sp. 1036]|uniref:hypothetical protein n=1 Tax=Alteromonadaceae TaxID=72275 RepID=UPI003D0308C8